MFAWHLGLDGTLLKKRQLRLNSLLLRVLLCHIQTWHLFESVVSASSLFLVLSKIWCLFQCHSQLLTFRYVLKVTNLLQSGVFISIVSFSYKAIMLMGSHLFHWQSE